ncbi:hypothetical protein EJ08DRAFT_681362 [Tothia fuscella]|uniref:Uncharacterized protein n=1 Tax=Tothia fuscella TaxID=1048955 RepID=A0A9P4NLL0_9PEZI|nr:hypothetical protein EJ08DRAFT_681362 [Tothia fuscella]
MDNAPVLAKDIASNFGAHFVVYILVTLLSVAAGSVDPDHVATSTDEDIEILLKCLQSPPNSADLTPFFPSDESILDLGIMDARNDPLVCQIMEIFRKLVVRRWGPGYESRPCYLPVLQDPARCSALGLQCALNNASSPGSINADGRWFCHHHQPSL